MSDSISLFLNDIVTPDYDLVYLPQDASGRKYIRIVQESKSFILKQYEIRDYDPITFIKITKILQENNIKVPRIYKFNNDSGLMLMEDLGPNTVKDFLVCSNFTDNEILEIYKDIVDLLIKMQKIDISYLETYQDTPVLLKGLELFINFFPKYLCIDLMEQEKNEFLSIFKYLFEHFSFSNNCFVHRDFHVENIMVKEGEYSLIDYQDASIGSPIYDLVSLTQDARIDVDTKLTNKIIDYYCTFQNLNFNQINDEYDLLGAQRNLRILGVFSYHKIKNNNDKYVQFIPRVLEYLDRNLSNPLLIDIRNYLKLKKIMS